MPPPCALAALAALAAAAAQVPAPAPLATGGFTQITSNFLAGTADVTDGFGAEDKMVICSGDLVFIDLDPDISAAWRYLYQPASGVWSKDLLRSNACPDSGQGGLLPRETGYVVGQTAGPYGGDRLLVLGGAASGLVTDENNVYYSDDCGLTWSCYDGNQVWNPRDFAAVLNPNGVLPYNPSVMLGGISEAEPGINLMSVAFFLSYDGGISWERPECATTANCRYPLTLPDDFGRCQALPGDPTYYQHCQLIPDIPALSGSIAADWTTLWLWYEPEDSDDDEQGGYTNGRVFYLNATNAASGWSQLPHASYGGQDGGRKIFLRGTAPGSGCFLNTDYGAEELWVYDDDYVVSTNFFQVASQPYGPWRNFTAPWPKRAAAALTTSWNSSVAYFGSGMGFTNGDADPTLPTFGDAWSIDTSVCLLGANGAPCSGHGVADLGRVTCTCFAGFSGLYCDVGSAPSNSQAGGGATPPGVAAGASIGVIIAIVAFCFAYSRWFAGTVPVVDSAMSAAEDLVQDIVKRARSISGGASSSSYRPRVPSTAKGATASPSGGSSPSAYGAI